MATIAHNLMIYDTKTGKLILTIRLTPLQVMALRPYTLAQHVDDPDLLLSYYVSCELFIKATTDP